MPGGDAADQAAAANRDQQRIELRRLLFEFQRQRALSQHGLVLVKGMDGQRARLLLPFLAGRQGIGIAVAAHHQFGAEIANAADLGGGRDRGHENLRPHALLARGIRHRRAVIAARSRDHAGVGNGAREKMGERAPRLEGARMLKKLQLQGHRTGSRPVPVQDRRAPDMRADALISCRDRLPVQNQGHALPFRS